MDAPGQFPLRSVPSAAGTIARLACAKLRNAGLPLEPLLRKAGLSIEQIDRESIEVRRQIKLVQVAAEALDDNLLGFHLARDFDLREVGLLYYVLASSNSFSDALVSAQRYTTIVNDGVRLGYRTGLSMTITLDYVGVERTSDRHQIEFWLVAMIRMCRQMTETRIAPLELKLQHFRDGTPPEFRALFGCDVAFGASKDEIVLPNQTKSLPIVGSDRHLHQLLVKYAEELLARRTAPRTNLRSRVEAVIAPLLPHGRANVSTVAQQLGMSARTLARELAADGESFSQIMDDYRGELAKAYLAHSNLSVSQVAWLLGYQEVSTLTHAFRRWFGMTPRQWRMEDRSK
ncbi:AraC family transcriptional regulator ligand-binding domain-containing protein [Bradyrhizobium sp.]|uniref:AraC family transcriptional regulator n=1 Tax=Bradyrhizobium sp. TaxID=376 RepID=UPI0039E631CA